jgi:hypothetical protein
VKGMVDVFANRVQRFSDLGIRLRFSGRHFPCSITDDLFDRLVYTFRNGQVLTPKEKTAVKVTCGFGRVKGYFSAIFEDNAINGRRPSSSEDDRLPLITLLGDV